MITALTDANQLPNQLQDQQTFDTNMAAMIDNLPLRAQQENALAANMSAYAAGGAYAFGYGFDSSTADADPGPGKLRFNSATQGSATRIMIDPVTLGGGNIGSLIAAIGANLSLLKGAIRVVKAADPTRWMIFDISSTFAASGYYALAVTFVAASSANPFSNGDALQVFLDRTGDRAVDLSPIVRIGGGNISSGTLNVDYLSLFSDDYYRYQIELTALRASATDTLHMRLAISGAVVTSSSYGALAADGSGTTTRTASFAIGAVGAGESCMTINIRGARSLARKGVGVNGFVNSASNYSKSGEGVFDLSSVLTGFRLYAAGASVTLDGGQIDIYGYRKV